MTIRNATFVTSAPNLDACPVADRPEICFAGRSNVGKSSLINAFTGRKKLAKTSGTPGKTRLLNYFDIDGTWYLVDLPGFGFAKVSQAERARWDQEFSRYLHNRDTLKLVLHLVDARHEPGALDLAFIERLAESGRPFSLVLTKTDTLSANGRAQSKARLNRALKGLGIEVPVVSTSAAAGSGLDELRGLVHDFLTDSIDIIQTDS